MPTKKIDIPVWITNLAGAESPIMRECGILALKAYIEGYTDCGKLFLSTTSKIKEDMLNNLRK